MLTLFDIEVYPNYVLIVFKDLDAGTFHVFDFSQRGDIGRFLKGRQLVGYNSNLYDDIILSCILKNPFPH